MLMRSEHDFYGGSVQDFSMNWIRYAHLIDDERYLDKVYETVHTGVDFLDFSIKVPRRKAGRFRKNCYVYSRAYKNLEYCLRYKGSKVGRKRMVDNFLLKKPTKKRKHDGTFVSSEPKDVPYTAGYYPVQRFHNKDGPDDRMVCPESKKSREYPTTIYKQLVKWLKTGVIEFLGSTRKLGKTWINLARLFLAIIVEPFKPRVCLGKYKSITKIPI